MNSRDDSFALLSQGLQQLNDLEGGRGIKTCGRLIQENDTWISNQLYTYRSSFPLATTDALDEGVSHLDVGTANETQLRYQILNYSMSLFLANICPEPAGKSKTFSRCKSSQ